MKKRESVDIVHTHGYLNNKGITLIALVITIIVLLILAGVVIATLTGDNGILQKATTAKQNNEKATELELIKLAVSAAQTKGEGTITTENLNNELSANLDDTAEPIGDNWNYKEYIIYKDGRVEKYDRLLPAEYQQVEYIESSGTQWIDTKIIANDVLTINSKFNITKLTGDHQGIFGGGWSSTNQTFQLILNTNTLSINLGYGGEYISVPYDTNIHNVTLSANKLVFDNEIKEISKEINDTRTFLLFVRRKDNFGSGIQQGSCSRIYFCEMKYKNNLTKNFIPCYSKTNVIDVNGKQCQKNAIGMYDTVEGKFYTNQGTGTFGYGMEDGTYVAPTNN